MAGKRGKCPTCGSTVIVPGEQRSDHGQEENWLMSDHVKQDVWLGFGVFFGGLLFALSVMYANEADTAFAWFLTCFAGVAFIGLASAIGLWAYKRKREGLAGAMALISILFLLAAGAVWDVGRRDRLYRSTFQPVISEFDPIYGKAYQDYGDYCRNPGSATSEVVRQLRGQIARDLQGQKLIWCDRSKDETLWLIVPGSQGIHGIFDSFASPGDQVDFLVVEHSIPHKTLLTVFHVPTKRIKCMCEFPFSATRRTDVVVPGPGSGVTYVDEKVGPVGLKHREIETVDHEGIRNYIKSVVLK
jgi:hypothetical protein